MNKRGASLCPAREGRLTHRGKPCAHKRRCPALTHGLTVSPPTTHWLCRQSHSQGSSCSPETPHPASACRLPFTSSLCGLESRVCLTVLAITSRPPARRQAPAQVTSSQPAFFHLCLSLLPVPTRRTATRWSFNHFPKDEFGKDRLQHRPPAADESAAGST